LISRLSITSKELEDEAKSEEGRSRESTAHERKDMGEVGGTNNKRRV